MEKFGSPDASLLCRGRNDAINHAAGKRAVFRDPRGKRRITPFGHFQNKPPDHMPVGSQVVAAEHGERGLAAGMAERKALDQEADSANGRLGIFQVSRNSRMRKVEPPCDRMKSIGLLRHGQRDDLDLRVGEIGKNLIAPVSRADPVDRRSDHLRRVAIRIADND